MQFAQEALARGNSEKQKKQKIKYKTTDDDSLRKMRTVNIMKKKGELRRKTHFFPLTSPVEFADDSEN